MPRIETYASSNNQINVKTQASDFADTSGLQNMQNALGETAQLLQKVQVQKDTLDYTKRASELQLQLMKDAEQINNSELPEGQTLSSLYEKNFKDRTNGFNIPSSIRNQVELDLERMKSSFSESGVREEARQAGIRARSDWEQSLINAQNIVSLNPNMAGAMQEQLQVASASLNIADAERDALFVDGQQRIAGAQAGAIAKSNPSAFISQAKAGKWNHVPNLDNYVSQAENKIKQVENESATSIEAETKNIINGLPSNPEVDAQIQKYSKSGSEKISAAYQTYQTVKTDVAAYKQMSPSEIASQINQTLIPHAYKDGATDLERQRLDIAQKYLSRSAQQIGDDTISYAVQNGVLPDGVQTLDVQNPQTFTSRVGAIKTASEKYGYSTFTTAMERQQLGAQLQSLQPKEKVQFLGTIREQSGEYAGKIISEITKDSSLELDYIGGMVASSQSFNRTAEIAFSGLKKMEVDKSNIPSNEGVVSMFDFGENYQYLSPESQAAIKKTATAIYVGMGGGTKSLDPEISKKAVSMAIGGIDGWEDSGKADINDKETYLPPAVRGSTFQQFSDNLTLNDISKMMTDKQFDSNGNILPIKSMSITDEEKLPKLRNRYGVVSPDEIKGNATFALKSSDSKEISYFLFDDEGEQYINDFGEPATITFTKQDMIDIISRRLK